MHHIYIYLCIYSDCLSLQKMAVFAISQKVAMEIHTKFTIASSATYVTTKRTVFGIDINLCTLIWLHRPAANPYTRSVSCHELLVGY